MTNTTEPLVLDPTGARRTAEHQQLHDRGPATKVDILGVTAHAISDPGLLTHLLTSPDVSKDARAHWPPFEAVAQTWPLSIWIAVENMFTAYGADHRRLRRMIAPAFSARRIAAMTDVVEHTVARVLDDLDSVPAGETVDLRARLAYPVPITVIGGLLGISDDRMTEFGSVVNGIFDTTASGEDAAANVTALYEIIGRLVEAKRADPGEDLTSLLIAVRDSDGDGQGLSEAELHGTLVLMISAGYETTVNAIDQAIALLLSHPEQLDAIRNGRANWSDAVEETLRLEPPVTHVPLRYAVADIPLEDGQVIPQGEALLVSVGAANRHPGLHGPNADAFDIHRTSDGHLAFGHGVHFCLGAPLARMEIGSVLRQLFERFPEITLACEAGDLAPLPSLISNGHVALPVRIRPLAA